MQGSLLAVLFIVILLSAGSLSFGAFLANFVSSEYQVMQLNPVISFPQIMLSGAWFPLQSCAGLAEAHLIHLADYLLHRCPEDGGAEGCIAKRYLFSGYFCPVCILCIYLLHGDVHAQKGDCLKTKAANFSSREIWHHTRTGAQSIPSGG